MGGGGQVTSAIQSWAQGIPTSADGERDLQTTLGEVAGGHTASVGGGDGGDDLEAEPGAPGARLGAREPIEEGSE